MLETIKDGLNVSFIAGFIIGGSIVAVVAGIAAIIWLEPKKGGEKDVSGDSAGGKRNL